MSVTNKLVFVVLSSVVFYAKSASSVVLCDLWEKRLLGTLILLASVPPPIASDWWGSGKDSDDVVSSAVSWFQSNTPLSYLSDETGWNEVNQEFSRALEKLDSMVWSCVKGLSYKDEDNDVAIKIWGGRYTRVKNSIKMDVRMGQAEGGVVNATVSFKFEEVELTYMFEYNSTMFSIPFTKSGSTKIVLGPATVEVNVRRPSSKKAIAEEAKNPSNPCKYTIERDDITTMASSNIKANCTYTSPTKRYFTKHEIDATVVNMKTDLYMNLGLSLGRHVAKAVQGIGFNCLSDDALEKWKELKAEDDCQESRNVLYYRE